MLKSLEIKNIILINHLTIQFNQGLTVIIGESGTGKSIIRNTILFGLGRRIGLNNKQLMRDHNMNSTVTVKFQIYDQHIMNQINAICNTQIILPNKHSLIFSRTILPSGRIISTINATHVTSNVLSQIGYLLLETHQQNEQIGLMKSSNHIDFIDHIGKLDEQVREVMKLYSQYNDLRNQMKQKQQELMDANKRREELLSMQEEIKNLNIDVGEFEKLENLKLLVSNTDKLIHNLQSIYDHLISQTNIEEKIFKARKILSRMSDNSQSQLTSIVSTIDNLEDIVCKFDTEMLQIIEEYSSLQNYDIDEIQSRLFAIQDIVSKYNVLPDEIPEKLIKIRQELNELNNSEAEIQVLENKIFEIIDQYFSASITLSQARHQFASILESKVSNELKDLMMDNTIFKVKIITPEIHQDDYYTLNNPNQIMTNKGIDSVEFVASTNLGLQLNKICKIASGGELSRLMLALKTILLESNNAPTIIFDEIDTGTSSNTASAIGKKLKALSKSCQVILITHQPRIVSQADQYIKTEKNSLNGQTSIKAHIVESQKDKIQALSHMMFSNIECDSLIKARRIIEEVQ